MMQLEDKHLVITGGAGALGQAVAKLALERGAVVTVIDRMPSDLRSGIRSACVDLGDFAAVKDLFDSLAPVDAVCALAGGFGMGSSSFAADDDQWDAMMQANVVSLRNVLKAVVPGMQTRNAGRIITVGAYSARQGVATMSAYTASKAVVMNLTESLAAELEATAIRVNGILPTIIDTSANRNAMPDADWRQWVSTGDIAEVICFLASAQSNALHGTLLPLKGQQQSL